MIDYKQEIEKAVRMDEQEAVEALRKIPEGIRFGKKVEINGKNYKYQYTEKQKYLLLYLHGLDVEAEMDLITREQHNRNGNF